AENQSVRVVARSMRRTHLDRGVIRVGFQGLRQTNRGAAQGAWYPSSIGVRDLVQELLAQRHILWIKLVVFISGRTEMRSEVSRVIGLRFPLSARLVLQ